MKKERRRRRALVGRVARRLRRIVRRFRARPQLLVRYGSRIAPAPPPLPEGYVTRVGGDSDRDSWMALLNANGQFGRWDMDRLTRDTHGLIAGGLIFVMRGDELAASASTYDRQVRGRAVWEVGWVARHPDHRERGLGMHASALAVAAALDQPKRPIVVLTDDHRLSAIAGYLAMGFEPDLRGHRSYAKRWDAVRAAIAEREAQRERGYSSQPS